MASRADDHRLYFASELGRRIRLGVDNTARQTTDTLGAIPPGKYLVQAVGLGANTMGVKAVPFVAGQTETHSIPAAPAAGAVDLADGILLTSGFSSFTLHIRSGVNDRLVSIMSAGTATLELVRTGT